MSTSNILRKIIRRWPGRETFGVFSLLPVFFVVGAGLEFCMIKLEVNGISFCMLCNKTAKQILELSNKF